MTSFREAIRRLIAPTQPLPPGLYHYQAPPDSPLPHRLHLRLEPDGRGMLLVNAATVLHLNQTAAEYAYHLIKGTPEDLLVNLIASRYRVDREQAAVDYRDLVERIQTLIQTPDLDPETFLDFERSMPYSEKPSAPYRLDCAITYQLPEDTQPQDAPLKRVERELTTSEWQSILARAWQAGIPHIIFTGGEPTLRADLPELIASAEQNGQITGVLTDGHRLVESGYLDTLLQTGLDHMMIVLRSESDISWQALENAAAADLFLAIHHTVTLQNALETPALLNRIAQSGVKAISLTTMDPNLRSTLQDLRNQAANLRLELVWDLPVPYSALNPVSLETLEDGVLQGAGRAWLYVEPDGDVLPAQGINQVLGNLLTEPWETVWQKVPEAI